MTQLHAYANWPWEDSQGPYLGKPFHFDNYSKPAAPKDPVYTVRILTATGGARRGWRRPHA